MTWHAVETQPVLQTRTETQPSQCLLSCWALAKTKCYTDLNHCPENKGKEEDEQHMGGRREEWETRCRLMRSKLGDGIAIVELFVCSPNKQVQKSICTGVKIDLTCARRHRLRVADLTSSLRFCIDVDSLPECWYLFEVEYVVEPSAKHAISIFRFDTYLILLEGRKEVRKEIRKEGREKGKKDVSK